MDKNIKEEFKNILWISYDLGIEGDYSGMYTFLDRCGALECGDSVARIKNYSYTGNIKSFLSEELKKEVNGIESNRVYYAFYSKENRALRSGFLFGKRKVAPWKGFSEDLTSLFEDDD